MSDRGNLCEKFVDRARHCPDDPFAIFIGKTVSRTLTNRWVLERSLAIGARLSASGLVVGDLVAIVLEHRTDLYPGFLGCMMHGLVPTFLPPLTLKQDPDVFRRSMAELFARATPAAVLTSINSRAHVPIGAWRIIPVEEIDEPFDGDAAATARGLLTELAVLGHDTAFLQHSSGTTGLRKGVMLSHRAVGEQLRGYAEAIGMTPDDVIASWLPLYHDMGLITGFLLPVQSGNVVVSLDALEWVARPALLLDAMQRYRAAFVWLPNFAFHHILRAVRDTDRWDLTSVKAIVNCAEPCRAATFDRFAERFTGMGIDQAKLRVCYAMAENVFAVTQTPPGAMVRRGETNDTRAFLSCGRPIDGVTVEIRMEDGSLAQSGAVGEIRVRSSTLFEGYFRQPGLSAERLRDDWFHTKDLGCMEAGELFVLGRVDDLLIVNGKNLFAHEIENLVSGLAGMAPGRTLACTEFDPRLGAMRLLVLGEPEAGVEDVATLESAIRQLVLSHTGIFPGTVRLLPRGYLLKSSSGKLARAASIRKYQGLLAYQSA